jgi:DNA topoisomerase-1
MAKENRSLVIVESPSKAKTINKFLGREFKVLASVGHIIDLPKSRFGVNIEDGFKPQYIRIRGKEKIINQLKKEAGQFPVVYLATDPDREGEAIAYHIASILDKDGKDIKRIEFNEITKNAITRAIESPREIDKARVDSQQARRVLDRIVGYQVSPLLWKTVYRGLSAGRVQSVALRMICEREQEIRDFVEEEFWTIRLEVKGIPPASFWTTLIKIRNLSTRKWEKFRIPNEEEVHRHESRIRESILVITGITRKRVKKSPGPPFITSTMQQAAARVLRFSTSKIMTVAQQLYEGVDIPGKGSVGLITYMRTDSTRISNEALNAARGYISGSFGEDYLPLKARVFRGKKSAQDAHEAIRPTYISGEYHPDSLKPHLSNDQYKLYNLIWKKFIASQMEAAQFDKTIVDITGGDYLFRSEGEIPVFDGYLRIYGLELENGDENGDRQNEVIPNGLKEDEKLQLLKLDPKQNFTKPPSRYSESTLVKELDRLNIGRPSTYAQIITTLIKRKYVDKSQSRLHATQLGETVNSILIKNFPDIFNVSFTAAMEDELDKIASRRYTYEKVMNDFYQPFTAAMEHVNARKDDIKSELLEDSGEKCEVCGRAMVIRWGRNGRFLACSGYPECKNTKPLEEREASKPTGEKCDKCGKPMVIKSGRYGKFMACSDYPTCKNTRPIPLGIKCPRDNCGGNIIERRSKRGKLFYGCSNYPKCDFVSWYKPVNQSCSSCGNNYLVEKYSKAKGNFLECPECKIVTPREDKQG